MCLSQFLTILVKVWTAYIKRMRRSKQWGGHIEIVAVANMLQVTICIVTDQPEPNKMLIFGFSQHFHQLQMMFCFLGLIAKNATITAWKVIVLFNQLKYYHSMDHNINFIHTAIPYSPATSHDCNVQSENACELYKF